MALVAGASL